MQTKPADANRGESVKLSLPARKSVPAPPGADIRRLALRGLAWSGLAGMVGYALNLGTTAILSRLLTPTDYGLMAMVGTLTLLLYQFTDFGLSWATVQSRELDWKDVDNLFWINVAVGVVLALMCVLGGPLLNTLYGRPDLKPVLAGCGVAFVAGGIAAQPAALLRRELRLGRLGLCNIVAQVAGALGAVWLAANGAHVWALVGQTVIGESILAALLLVAAGYRPGRPHLDRKAWQLVKFGGYLTGFALCVYVSRNFDNILIGRFWGPEQLGYYSRAYFLMFLPSSLAAGILGGVMVPAMSAMADDHARLEAAYRRSLKGIGLVGFPAAVGLLVTAPEAVRLVYGIKWLEVVPLVGILSLASVVQPPYITISWLFVPAGKGRELFYWGVVSTLVLAVAFCLGVSSGARGVALAYSVAMPLAIVGPGLYCAHRAAKISFGPSLRLLARPMIASVAMGIIAWTAGIIVRRLGASWQEVLFAKVATGIGVYVCLYGPRRIVSMALLRK